jgi:hypothetical protein
MEKDKKGNDRIAKKLDIVMELIEIRPGKVTRRSEISEEGTNVEKYFLITRDGAITELYFSKENLNESGFVWYGSIAYSTGIAGKSSMGKFTLKGKKAEKGFLALKKRYENEEKIFINHIQSHIQPHEKKVKTKKSDIKKEKLKKESFGEKEALNS